MVKKLFAVLILGSALGFLSTGCSVNPVTGENQFNLFGDDVADDVAMGRQWSPELEKEFGGAFEDEHIQSYVDYVGQNIAQVSHAPYIEWHCKVLEHEMINAFAVPGGYIYITTGMLEKLENEAQLAGILGHEAAHVTLRHSTQRMSEQIGVELLLSAVMPENASAGVAQATSIARQIISLKYSRDDERQADAIGLGYMMRAGYNPYEMVRTMQMLEKESEQGHSEFLSSHPSPENRQELLLEKIETSGYNTAEMKVRKDDYQRIVLERLKKHKKESKE